jgi:hypothetical protein
MAPFFVFQPVAGETFHQAKYDYSLITTNGFFAPGTTLESQLWGTSAHPRAAMVPLDGCAND